MSHAGFRFTLGLCAFVTLCLSGWVFLSKPCLCPFNIFPNLALERLQGWEDPLAAEFFQERDFYGFAVQVAAQAEEVQFQHARRPLLREGKRWPDT